MLRLETRMRNAVLNTIAAELSGGSIALYTADQTLLGTLKLGSPAARPAALGVLTFAAIQPAEAAATGVAALARVSGKDGKTVFDCDVGGDVQATSGVIQLNTTAIALGGPISLSAFTLSFPG